MTTLNAVLDRIKTIVEAHKMVRSYDVQGLSTEFNNDKTAKYPAVQLIPDPNNAISATAKLTTFSFKMIFEDLVHVSEDSKMNEWDVVSDMNSIAEDIMTQMLNPNYDDWKISQDNAIQFLFENENDLTAGVVLNFTASYLYKQNRCQVPSSLVIDETPDTMDKLLYDVEYIADGTEGTSLDTSATGSTLNVVTGKKIVLITREMSTIHKVSNLPDPAEYSWNDTVVTLGTATNQGERFLILYRNY